jgi:DNA-binding transcriptional regulator LsrR (DeoR family)
VDVERIKNREQLECLNVAELGSKFGLTKAQIEALLQAFLDTGLIEIDPKDRIHIVFDKVTHHLPQREYLKSVLSELARKIDSDFENKEAIFRSFIFSMEKKHIPGLRSELIQLFEKYMTKHSSNSGENALIQSFVGAFPVF